MDTEMIYRAGGKIVTDMALKMSTADDKSGETLNFLDEIDDPDPKIRAAATLGRIRSMFERAVLIRKYSKAGDKLQACNVTVGYVVVERGQHITEFESFNNNQCFRVIFCDDPNDYAVAYMTVDLANRDLERGSFS